jgi:methylisocitrate lyase
VLSNELQLVSRVYNTAVALMAERLGYKAVYVSDAITTLGMGLPDLGIIKINQMAYEVKKIASMISVPLICNADISYGNVEKMVRKFE